MNTFILIFIGLMALAWLWSLCAAAHQAEVRAADFVWRVENPFVPARTSSTSSHSEKKTELNGDAVGGVSVPANRFRLVRSLAPPAAHTGRDLFRLYLKSAGANHTAANVSRRRGGFSFVLNAD